MSNRESIERAIISCLMQGGDKIKYLCQEFMMTSSHFQNERLGGLYIRLMYGIDVEALNLDDFIDFVPSPDNARYYLEELHSLQPKKSIAS